MKNTIRILASIMAAAILAPSAAVAIDIQGELGLLTLATLQGTNPATGSPWQAGDPYRLVFITSEAVDAQDTNNVHGSFDDISTWNAIAQTFAENADQSTLANATWKVIGSTVDVDARDNTATNPTEDGDGHPIILIDGATLVATNFVQLWSGEIENIIDLTENFGENINDAPGSLWPFTGTLADGTTQGAGGALRDISASGTIRQGRGNDPVGWIDRDNMEGEVAASTDSPSTIYAMSEPLAIQRASTPTLIVYEGFAYTPALPAPTNTPQGTDSAYILTGEPDGTENDVDAIGLNGVWGNTANNGDNMYLVEGSFTFGDLITSGNHLRYHNNSNNDIYHRPLLAAAANDIGTASEIWFSFLANKLQNNFSAAEGGLVIGNQVVNNAKILEDDGSTGLSGFGIAPTTAGNNWTAYAWDGTTNGSGQVVGDAVLSVATDGSETNLLVGHVSFDTGTGGTDVFTLYQYDPAFADGNITSDIDKLNEITSLEADVDQTLLDTLNVTRQVNTAYDEIRIGLTLKAVLPVPPPAGTVLILH